MPRAWLPQLLFRTITAITDASVGAFQVLFLSTFLRLFSALFTVLFPALMPTAAGSSDQLKDQNQIRISSESVFF